MLDRSSAIEAGGSPQPAGRPKADRRCRQVGGVIAGATEGKAFYGSTTWPGPVTTEPFNVSPDQPRGNERKPDMHCAVCIGVNAALTLSRLSLLCSRTLSREPKQTPQTQGRRARTDRCSGFVPLQAAPPNPLDRLKRTADAVKSAAPNAAAEPAVQKLKARDPARLHAT